MLSKRYESTDLDRRTLQNVPSGTLLSTSSDNHQVVEIQNETQLRCIHHFKSYSINNMKPYAHFGYWTLFSDP